MGSSLSTIQGALRERFLRQDKGHKGYLTVDELIGMQPQFGVSPCHIAVLFLIDRNADGRFSLEELLEFSAFAHNYARVHRGQDAGFIVTGFASLKLFSFLHSGAHTQQFVDWCVRVFTEGCVRASLRANRQPLAKSRALKAMHAVFELERNHACPYDALVQMVQQAAQEEQLLPPLEQWKDVGRWIPVQVLTVFVAAVAEGCVRFMASFAPDAGELLDVLRRAEAAAAAAGDTQPGGRASTRARSSSGGGVLTPLNLKRQALLLR